MSFASDADTIRSRFATQFAAVRPGVPIAYQNGPPLSPTPTAEFVRIGVQNAVSKLVGLGDQRRFRNRGITDVQIFVPLGVGDGLLREIADDVRDIFLAMTVSGVTFRTPSLTVVGEAGPFFQGNVDTEFYADFLAA